FAPRFGLAYGPQNRSGLIGKLFGKSGAFRAGAGMVYDRFGSDLVAQYDQYGSIGLATATNFADSYSFITSPRFTGSARRNSVPIASSRFLIRRLPSLRLPATFSGSRRI